MVLKIGERIIPMIIPHSAIAPMMIPGVQALGWGPNTERNAKGEFGTIGEVKSWIVYKNESGSFDVEDIGKLDELKAVLCGEDPANPVQFLDWSKLDTVDIYINQYDENLQYIEKSGFLLGVDINPQSQDSNLESVGVTQKFDFTSRRGIEFVGAEIYLEHFNCVSGKRDYQFKRLATEFPKVKRKSLIHFLPFGFALKVWTINKTTGEVIALTPSEVEISEAGAILKNPLTSDTELFVLHLCDPQAEEIIVDKLEPVIVKATALLDDTVILTYSENIEETSITASDYEVSGTNPDTATLTAADEITLDFTTTGGVILADQLGVQVVYTQGTLKDKNNNLAPSQNILTS